MEDIVSGGRRHFQRMFVYKGFWISHQGQNQATLCVCACARLCVCMHMRTPVCVCVCVSGVARGEWGSLIMNALIWYSSERKDKPLY